MREANRFSMKIRQRKVLPFGEGVFQTQQPDINQARETRASLAAARCEYNAPASRPIVSARHEHALCGNAALAITKPSGDSYFSVGSPAAFQASKPPAIERMFL